LGSLILRRFGGGREEVVVVASDGIADGPAPPVGVEGVDVLVLGKMDGLEEGLGEIGEGAAERGLMSPRATPAMRRPSAALRSQAERYGPEKK